MVKKIKIYCFLETYFNKYAMTDSWIIISGTLNSHQTILLAILGPLRNSIADGFVVSGDFNTFWQIGTKA